MALLKVSKKASIATTHVQSRFTHQPNRETWAISVL